MPQLNEAQKDARSKGVGGSDIPVILGAVKYKTPVQLWLEKRGVEKPEDIGGRLNIRMGHKLEPIVVELFEEETGFKCRKQNMPRVHKRHPFMVGNVDRDIIGESAGFEAKAFSPWTRDEWGENGSGDVPLAVTAQCAHYMEIYGYQAWYVGVLLGIHDFRWFKLERHQPTIDKLIEIEREFWKHVTDSTMPRILTGDDVAKLYPNSHDIIRCTDQLMEHNAVKLREMKDDAKALEDQIERLSFLVKDFMKGHGSLWAMEGIDPLVTWNASKDRHVVDHEAVLAEILDLYTRYIDDEELAEIVKRNTKNTVPGPRMFLVKKKGVGQLLERRKAGKQQRTDDDDAVSQPEASA